MNGIQSALNPSLAVEGGVLTMFDSRMTLSNQVKDEVQKFFGDKLFKISGANVQQRCTLYAKTGLITGSGTGLKGFNAVLLQKQGLILGYGIDGASPATGEAAIEE